MPDVLFDSKTYFGYMCCCSSCTIAETKLYLCCRVWVHSRDQSNWDRGSIYDVQVGNTPRSGKLGCAVTVRDR